MDHHVPRAVTVGLRLREIDVLTAFEDGNSKTDDPDLLDRATMLGRALFTQDDLLVEAARRQAEAKRFSGVIYAQQRVTIGIFVEQLELVANVLEPGELENRVVYLPL